MNIKDDEVTGDGWRRITIRLPEEEYKRLRVWAASHGVGMGPFIRQLILLAYEHEEVLSPEHKSIIDVKPLF